ncbi:eukaryotic translation initiation factor 4 gamma 1-like [Trichomycterus rosablanca]|uniref:eukaryotic translation initiation factor 4 gamma 1-like n=1 Tax=Trichomycterus rosablanca TaxID=2290929 RepID=UPI002F358638
MNFAPQPSQLYYPNLPIPTPIPYIHPTCFQVTMIPNHQDQFLSYSAAHFLPAGQYCFPYAYQYEAANSPARKQERKRIIIKDPTQGGRDITDEIMSGRWAPSTATPSHIIIKDPTQGGRDITEEILSGRWTTSTATPALSVDAEVKVNDENSTPPGQDITEEMISGRCTTSVETPTLSVDAEVQAKEENSTPSATVPHIKQSQIANTQQRNKYSRSFLLSLQLNSSSLQKPKVLTDIPEVVLNTPLMEQLYLRDVMNCKSDIGLSISKQETSISEPVDVQDVKTEEEHHDLIKPQQKKKYDRNFLLSLQFVKSSLERPKVLTNIPEVLLEQPLMQQLPLRDLMTRTTDCPPLVCKLDTPTFERVEVQEDKLDRKNIKPEAESCKRDNLVQKIKYDREFLLSLQLVSASLQKPKVQLHDTDVVLDKPQLDQLYLRDQMLCRKNNANLSKQGVIGCGPQKQLKKVRRISTSIPPTNDRVQLNKAENAWMPAVKKSCSENEDPEAAKTQELFRNVRSILNKLTPQMFEQLMKQITKLPINTEERLHGVVNLIFEKAVSEPHFSSTYANMCHSLMELKVPTSDKSESTWSFHKVLLSRCQQEFEKDKKDDKLIEQKQKELDEATKEKDRQLFKNELEELRIKARTRSLGNIKFMGELYKLKMITEQIMHDCIKKLLKNEDEESLECLSKLLSTAGKDLDSKKDKLQLDQYFHQMEKIIREKKTSSRIRFMLQDVLDLRQNNWVSRRVDQGPKTIDQVHKEAEMEQHVEQLQVQQKRLSKKHWSQRQGGQINKTQYNRWNTAPFCNNDKSHHSKITKPGVLQPLVQAHRGNRSWGSQTSRFSNGTKDTKGNVPFSKKPEVRSQTGEMRGVSNMMDKRGNATRDSREHTVNLKSAPAPPAPAKPALNEEQVEKKSAAIVEEYLHINDLKEALQCVQELNSESLLFVFVRHAVEMTLERTTTAREHMGLLLRQIISAGVLPTEQYYKGLHEILEVADDMAIDIPHIWQYLAEVITPMLQDGGIPMAQLFRLALNYTVDVFIKTT